MPLDIPALRKRAYAAGQILQITFYPTLHSVKDPAGLCDLDELAEVRFIAINPRWDPDSV